MGKKGRKTRWRTLEITGESDSEESSTLTGPQIPRSYHHKSYYSKFSYSSQSTPTRRYQHDSKSTRSSSTASENKITFNEDEYTRITTPRQDVLFKKGYLNKPKNYQTQTSTGNSTTSTGNSSTPDHQSADGTEGTDLEYESQFVFPNAFVDQNGVYYVNSFEAFPLVMYNHPVCYPEYQNSRSKRYSTDSMTESTSPNNEETSQELNQSGGETTGNAPEFNHAYNVICPEMYFNGASGPNAMENGQGATEPRKIKKKRRRKVSKSLAHDGSTTSSSDEYDSSDDIVTQVENRVQDVRATDGVACTDAQATPLPPSLGEEAHARPEQPATDPSTESHTGDQSTEARACESGTEPDHVGEVTAEIPAATPEGSSKQEDAQEPAVTSEQVETVPVEEVHNEVAADTENSEKVQPKFNLNAEEFVPRAYRNIQYLNMPPGFIPIPILNPMNELGGPNFNQAFLPPGIPINFHLPPDPKLMSNFVNYLPNPNYVHKTSEAPEAAASAVVDKKEGGDEDESVPPTEVNPAADDQTEDAKTADDVKNTESKAYHHKNDIDIARIVSKLEEAAKEQQSNESKRNFRYSGRFNRGQKGRPYNSNFRHDSRPNYEPKANEGKYARGRDNFTRSEERHRKPEDVCTTTKAEDGQEPEPKPNQTQPKEHSVKPDQQAAEPQSGSKKPAFSRDQTSPLKAQARQQTYRRDYYHKDQNANQKTYYGSPRRQNSSPGKTPSAKPNQVPDGCSNTQAKSPNNYSETVKKPTHVAQGKKCPRFEQYADKGAAPASSTPTRTKLVEDAAKPPTPKTPKTPNQWISVSSRKKRKNRNVSEEIEETFEVESNDVELFETYDVTLLEDVAHIKNEETSTVDTSETKQNQPEESLPATGEQAIAHDVQNFMEMASRVSLPNKTPEMSTHAESDNSAIVLMQDVNDIEKVLLQDVLVTQEDQAVEEVLQNTPKKQAAKKKSKKGTQKPLTKRVIILDADLSNETAKAPEKKPVETKAPEATENAAPVEETGPQEESLTVRKEDAQPAADAAELTEDISEKRKNKKKKKPKSPLTKVPSVTSSTTTLNANDDSYEFLLDTTVLEEKTNVEISQELDKMIQKGMYSNLEEKIRSLDASFSNDNFFKTINYRSPIRSSTPEKSFIKATNFGELLRNATQMMNVNKQALDELKNIDIDFSQIKLPEVEPQPSTSKFGTFLEQLQTEVGAQAGAAESKPSKCTGAKSNGKLKNKSKKNVPKKEAQSESKTRKESDGPSKSTAETQAEGHTPEKTIESADIRKKTEVDKANLAPVVTERHSDEIGNRDKHLDADTEDVTKEEMDKGETRKLIDETKVTESEEIKDDAAKDGDTESETSCKTTKDECTNEAETEETNAAENEETKYVAVQYEGTDRETLCITTRCEDSNEAETEEKKKEDAQHETSIGNLDLEETAQVNATHEQTADSTKAEHEENDSEDAAGETFLGETASEAQLIQARIRIGKDDERQASDSTKTVRGDSNLEEIEHETPPECELIHNKTDLMEVQKDDARYNSLTSRENQLKKGNEGKHVPVEKNEGRKETDSTQANGEHERCIVSKSEGSQPKDSEGTTSSAESETKENEECEQLGTRNSRTDAHDIEENEPLTQVQEYEPKIEEHGQPCTRSKNIQGEETTPIGIASDIANEESASRLAQHREGRTEENSDRTATYQSVRADRVQENEASERRNEVSGAKGQMSNSHVGLPNGILSAAESTTRLDTKEASKATLPLEEIELASVRNGTTTSTAPVEETAFAKSMHPSDSLEAAKDTSSKTVEPSKVIQAGSSRASEEKPTKTLYPITQAVKEWMTKTRENTPEVEILKSPDTIYKEFIEEDDTDEEVETRSKNGKSNPVDPRSGAGPRRASRSRTKSSSAGVARSSVGSEEEITVFENWAHCRENGADDDISECWEDDVMYEGNDKAQNGPKVNGFAAVNGCDKRRNCDSGKELLEAPRFPKNGCRRDPAREGVEEGEDVLEIYESKYGTNEDYLKLKAEIEEERKKGTLPKHGDLPYKAICCNVM